MPVLTLLVIDDDEVDRKTVSRALKTLGTSYELLEARDGRHGLELARSRRIDCILVDYNLPDMNGLEVLAELRDHLGVTAPVVMLTGSGNESIAVEAMKGGAHDYVSKAKIGPEALSRAVVNAIEKNALQRKFAEAQHKLEHLALYDVLTGLGNRNLFYLELARTIAVAHRKNKAPFPVLMMDLDKFKAANDAFGHEAGDAILTAVGSRLRGISRAADVYFRVGGDEFTAILDPGSAGDVAAQRVIEAILQPIRFGPHRLEVAVSIGLAIYPSDGQTAEDLVRAADAAMYEAKKLNLGWAAAADMPVHR
jgi:diguanylate cyclase (GGDEF)-like protein